ncbi:RagB/SusD family nutrient uptake outer membrane protein [Pedobacter sp. V48]|uniref:RagB/SusD family nutrient uptake outer membrane protein n=1 Tax=Pedobacter sp. V48 TaxID=509635 RepID=UPI0003E494CA|nr:RagB/SusD family nutrient uptake outer membrane protein [Pedobacter sp. V48]ETZ21503.1 membrane protein [Pedobacter sp. V48]
MKKIYYLVLITTLFTFLGCEKFLTHDHPTDVYDEIWWNTEANVTSALNSIYAGMPDGSSGRQLMFLDAMSDNAVARQSLRGDYESYVKGLQGSNWAVGTGIWDDDYRDIRRSNRFLENVDKAYLPDPELKKQYIYEARALRAYYHMELFMFFGPIAILKQSVTPENSYLPRNTEKEVYDFILAELNECANNLPPKFTVNADLKRISAGTCLGLISKLALYYKDYGLAKSSAKRIIDMDAYSLRKSANVQNSYADLFLYVGEINSERIFFREVTSGGNQWLTFAPQGTGGKTVVSPTASIVNAYETKQGKTLEELGPDSAAIYAREPNYHNNRDSRMAASIILPGATYTGVVLKPFENSGLDKLGEQNSTSTGYWINKYLDPKDKTGTRTLDFMIMRYAEVLLNYVESLIELDDFSNPDVIKYLNEIRNRAGMPNVNVAEYNTKEKLRELVRRERRVELAFEGVRYYDIRRWGIFEQVMNGPVTGAIDPNTNQPVNVEVRSAKANRDYLWPIPQKELLANPQMTQNPNYN